MAIETPGDAEATGTMDRVEVEYFDWDPEGSPVSIHMHLGAMDGISRDVVESFGAPPQPILEVGGLLLGRVTAEGRPVVWIERYQRIPCGHGGDHRFGPQFVPGSDETAALEAAAAEILQTGELAVVGFYRSHARPGLQVEESDLDLIHRYFNDPSDLILLVKPENSRQITGQFHAWDEGGGTQPAGGVFPFHGHVVTPDTLSDTVEAEDETEATGISAHRADAPAVPSEYRPQPPRRIVPDFLPSPVEPPPSLYGLSGYAAPDHATDELTHERGTAERLKKWLPLVAALVLVGGILGLLLRPGDHGSTKSATPKTAETARPLGLYVDPAGPAWRVLWNPNATALHDARSVQLFVREKDDQIRIELAARDLASGSYQYRPMGNDVTFRLEVVDHAGQVSAESFRLTAASNPVAPSVPPPAPHTQPSPAAAGSPLTVLPKAIYRAPPVVAAGVRPRIKGMIPIDVRVHIDPRGRVVSASPVTSQHSGLEQYLAKRAVLAARLWRFAPARENGKPVPGTSTIHFTFEK